MPEVMEDQVPLVSENGWYASCGEVSERLAKATSVAEVLGSRTQIELGYSIQRFVACGIRAARIERERIQQIEALHVLARKRNSDGKKAREQLGKRTMDREAVIVHEALNFTRGFLRYLQDTTPFEIVLDRDAAELQDLRSLMQGVEAPVDVWMRSFSLTALDSLGLEGFWCFVKPGMLPPIAPGWHAECLSSRWREQGVPLPADGSLPWLVTRHDCVHNIP